MALEKEGEALQAQILALEAESTAQGAQLGQMETQIAQEKAENSKNLEILEEKLAEKESELTELKKEPPNALPKTSKNGRGAQRKRKLREKRSPVESLIHATIKILIRGVSLREHSTL